MVRDVLPDLLAEVQELFDRKLSKDEVVKRALAILREGKATYGEANDYALAVGELLADVLGQLVTVERLPDGRMYYNIAERLLTLTLERNYELISEYAGQVQSLLNHQAGLGIRAQVPEFNRHRVAGLVDKMDGADDFSQVSNFLLEAVVNFSQSVVDDSIKANAEFHAKAGLSPKIVRKSAGSCCDWCSDLVGTYDYPDVPDDVYHRHRYCRCTVDYFPGDGKKQNVWSKKETKVSNDILEQRKQMHLDIQDNLSVDKRKSDKEEYKKIVDVLGWKEAPETLAKFKELKYNDSEGYSWLKRDVRFTQELAAKDWSESFKGKSRAAYQYFKQNDISMSTHAISRLPRLNKSKFVDVSEEDIVQLLKGKPNFLEGGQKQIYFDLDKQLAVIKNQESGDVVSIVRRKSEKESWIDVSRSYDED